ncbi:hypothetical protein ABG067_000558 [Albugo candida]
MHTHVLVPESLRILRRPCLIYIRYLNGRIKQSIDLEKSSSEHGRNITADILKSHCFCLVSTIKSVLKSIDVIRGGHVLLSIFFDRITCLCRSLHPSTMKLLRPEGKSNKEIPLCKPTD